MHEMFESGPQMQDGLNAGGFLLHGISEHSVSAGEPVGALQELSTASLTD